MVKKIPLLPNIVTAFGLSCGLFVIFRTTLCAANENEYQSLVTSVILLLVAAFADLLDGFLARALKSESDFGGIFDCLADAISFGVAPAVIVLKTLSLTPESHYSYLITTATMVYAVCGVLRLVRFNVAAHRDKGNLEAIEASKKHFTGLPIPAAGAAIISANLLFVSPDFRAWFPMADQTRILWLCGALLLIGYLMISRWRFFSLKTLHIRVGSFNMVLATAIGAVLIFYGILQHFSVTLFVISWVYVLLALCLSLIRYFAGKRMKQLEDFEPEPEEPDTP